MMIICTHGNIYLYQSLPAPSPILPSSRPSQLNCAHKLREREASTEEHQKQNRTAAAAGMQGNNARRRSLVRNGNGAASGSVWEARMRVDAVNGGVKVFTGDEGRNGDGDSNADEEGMRVYRRLRRNQSDSIAAARKRRIWTAPPSAPVSGSPLGGDKSRLRVLAICDSSEGGLEGDEKEAEVGIEVGSKSFDDKEMDLPVHKGKSMEETINQVHEIPISSMLVEKKQSFSEILAPLNAESKLDLKSIDPDLAEPSPSLLGKRLYLPATGPPSDAEQKNKMNNGRIDPDPAETPVARKKVMDHGTGFPDPIEESSFEGSRKVFDRASSRNHTRMQSIVDLVMWRDVPKTAFVFGLGTFFLISSSYANDLNFSLVSVSSYLALIYLALIFVYKSILRRGENVENDEGDERYMVGEEEAIWLLRLLLPYFNELLFKMRSLFSGDPATTMKLAVLLFVMAKCGSSITIWTLSKLMFLGVFTVPKISTSYSTQLTKFGKFWLERFKDGWQSCTHKKAVAAAIFTLIWNISSAVARIWAIFMLVVALKFYQQCVAEDWSRPEEVVVEEAQEASTLGQCRSPALHHRRGGRPKRDEVMGERKVKKAT